MSQQQQPFISTSTSTSTSKITGKRECPDSYVEQDQTSKKLRLNNVNESDVKGAMTEDDVKDNVKGAMTKDDVNENAMTKDDVKDNVKGAMTKDDVKDNVKGAMTKDDVKGAMTKDDVKNDVTKDDVTNTITDTKTNEAYVEVNTGTDSKTDNVRAFDVSMQISVSYLGAERDIPYVHLKFFANDAEWPFIQDEILFDDQTHFKQLWKTCQDHSQTIIPSEVCNHLSMNNIIKLCSLSGRCDLLDDLLEKNKLIILTEEQCLFHFSVSFFLGDCNMLEWWSNVSERWSIFLSTFSDHCDVLNNVMRFCFESFAFPIPHHVGGLLLSNLDKLFAGDMNEQDLTKVAHFCLNIVDFIIRMATRVFAYLPDEDWDRILPYFSWAVQMMGYAYPKLLHQDYFNDQILIEMKRINFSFCCVFDKIVNTPHPTISPLHIIHFFEWKHFNILQHAALNGHNIGDWFLCKNPDVHFVLAILLSGRNKYSPRPQKSILFESGLIGYIFDFIKPVSFQPQPIGLNDDTSFFQALRNKPPGVWYDHSILPGLLLSNEIERFNTWKTSKH